MLNFKMFFELIRWKQVLFKNSIILIPFIFALNKISSELVARDFVLILAGFLCISLISASSYIINDIRDREKDKKHSKKRYRPIASGKISVQTGWTISVFLLVAGMLLTIYLSAVYSHLFLVSVLLLFILSQAYTFYFRNVIFLDIIIISSLFVLRAVSGLFLINTPFSYWIILCAFFLSMFMVSKKRISEIEFERIGEYRHCYRREHIGALKMAAIASACAVILFFCIYSIFIDKPLFLLSLPIAVYLMFSYYNSPRKIIESEGFIFNKKTIILLLIWVLLIIIAREF